MKTHRHPWKTMILGTCMVAGALSTAARAQVADVQLQQLSWLVGCWGPDDEQTGSSEQWQLVDGKTLAGSSESLRKGRVVGHESMRIAPDEQGRLTYYAHPEGQAETAFVLSSLDSGEAVFDNSGHDFPQRIVYQSLAPDAMLARLEAGTGDTLRVMDFPMQRVECTAPGN